MNSPNKTNENLTAAEQPGTTRWNADVRAAAAILIAGLLCLYGTFRFDEVPPMLSQNIPPTFFPRVILTGLIAMSGLLLVRGIGRRERPPERIRPIVYATGGAIAAGLLLLSHLGTYILIFLICLSLPVLWGERRYGRVVLFAVLTPAIIYLLFDRLLGLRLPPGLLEAIG